MAKYNQGFWRSDWINLPNWVKPELAKPIYWVHLLIIYIVFEVILTLWTTVTYKLPLTFDAVQFFFLALIIIPALAIGDFIAHTILQLD